MGTVNAFTMAQGPGRRPWIDREPAGFPAGRVLMGCLSNDDACDWETAVREVTNRHCPRVVGARGDVRGLRSVQAFEQDGRRGLGAPARCPPHIRVARTALAAPGVDHAHTLTENGSRILV